MKTIDTVEPRTAIRAADLPLTIHAPGSYYLAEDIAAVGGITIAADDVTLDLMGFALTGTTGDGVVVVGFPKKNIVVRNGTVSGWPEDGVDATFGQNCRFEKLLLSANGGNGLKARDNAVITECTTQENGSVGIFTSTGCAVSKCTARANAGAGISVGNNSTVVGCTADSNTGVGIVVGFGSRVRDSAAAFNGDDGFTASADAVVQDCTARNNTGDGIQVSSECHVLGNHCTGNGTSGGNAAGVHATGEANRIENNTCLDADRGLDVDAPNNDVVSNTVHGNTDNYDIAPGNRLNILLGEIPATIDWPATVTLAGTLTGTSGQDGITITSDDVTIDLAGHSLIGVAGALDGIHASGDRHNLMVRNGVIHDWGDDGVDLGNLGENHRLHAVAVHTNGNRGIYCGRNAVVESCAASANGADGIYCQGVAASVRACTAYLNGSTGIQAPNNGSIVDCAVYENSGDGVSAGSGSVVSNCSSRNNGGDGIRVSSGSTVTACSAISNGDDGVLAFAGSSTITDCTLLSNDGDGIQVSSDCLALNNTCSTHNDSDDAGIRATSSGNRIEGNNVNNGGRGIMVESAGNIVIRNSARNNTVDYDIVAGNDTGPVGSAATATSPWANFSY